MTDNIDRLIWLHETELRNEPCNDCHHKTWADLTPAGCKCLCHVRVTE